MKFEDFQLPGKDVILWRKYILGVRHNMGTCYHHCFRQQFLQVCLETSFIYTHWSFTGKESRNEHPHCHCWTLAQFLNQKHIPYVCLGTEPWDLAFGHNSLNPESSQKFGKLNWRSNSGFKFHCPLDVLISLDSLWATETKLCFPNKMQPVVLLEWYWIVKRNIFSCPEVSFPR